ncbi:MAG TPA: ABC transporter ATP-binding protein [Myxococcota bacterium]|nr:ABC transporter ATP-binding protein [Myxococcota bacterium]HQK52480.1 ABC transporter ATP-binding protein [Myxococcota bacterium]
MGEVLLEARDLWKSYHRSGAEIPVLRGTDFRLEAGERVAVLGKSGVGKSTLLHVLGTLDRPERGRVLFRGADLTGRPEGELAVFRNRKLGFVFQFHHLLPEFSALENVMIPAIIAGTSRREAARLAGDLLEAVGLSHRQSHRPAELSGGEQQRVAMARALVMRPEVILADEPTGNLDETTSEEVHGLMLDLNGRFGVAFVVATHNLRLAERMGRVLRLENGVLHPVEVAS